MSRDVLMIPGSSLPSNPTRPKTQVQEGTEPERVCVAQDVGGRQKGERQNFPNTGYNWDIITALLFPLPAFAHYHPPPRMPFLLHSCISKSYQCRAERPPSPASLPGFPCLARALLSLNFHILSSVAQRQLPQRIVVTWCCGFNCVPSHKDIVKSNPRFL